MPIFRCSCCNKVCKTRFGLERHIKGTACRQMDSIMINQDSIDDSHVASPGPVKRYKQSNDDSEQSSEDEYSRPVHRTQVGKPSADLEEIMMEEAK